ALIRHPLDVFFATATVAPLLCRAPVVLAVQFLQFYEWPDTYGALRTAYLRTMVPLSLRKAEKAIIFTSSAKQDLIRWTGAPAEKVCVVPHGLSEDLWGIANLPSDAPQRRIGVDLAGGRPYILYVSATYGYKNHLRLIQAFGLLKRRTEVPHVLLLVGDEMAVPFAELRMAAIRAGVADEVILAGRLDPYERVVATYLGADLTVIPTLYETFGFPLLEAMACGSPVVAANCGSTAELAGDAALLIDPLDVGAIADGMARVLSDPVLRRSLTARGQERAREYTWERTAAETLRILEEVGR
ncbi:MAG: glycosyltransferase family 4 protein, partial [Armatimonadota bacterium]